VLSPENVLLGVPPHQRREPASAFQPSCAGSYGMVDSTAGDNERSADARSTVQARVGDTLQVLQVLRAAGGEYLLVARVPERPEDVLVRLIIVDSEADPTRAARELREFERRAELAARLDHPNILPAGSLQQAEGIAYYVVLRASDRTLDDVLISGQPILFDRAMLLLHDIAAALDHAAEQGVVHGQLEPSAIVLAGGGRARVADFAAPAGEPLSRSGRLAAYRAPELWQHGVVADSRSDIYALAVIAYELITGRRRDVAHGAHGIAIVDALQLTHDVPLREKVPLYVNDSLLRAVSKRPAARFATATELVAALEGRLVTPAGGMATQRPTPIEDRSRGLAVVPLTLAVLIGIGLGIFATPSARQMLGWAHKSSSHGDLDPFPTLSNQPGFSSTSGSSAPAPPSSPPSGTSSSSSGSGIFPGAATAAGPPGAQGRFAPAAPSSASAPTVSSSSDASAGSVTSSRDRSTQAPALTDSATQGYIRVSFDGPPALVMIDEIPRGRTPFVGSFDAGTHNVRLVGSRAEFPITQVRVSTGDTAVASFSPPRSAP
jgi:serine/threonine protein kinase